MPTKMPTVPCAGCGKPIVWAKCRRDDGTAYRVPLDPAPAVFMVSHDDGVGVLGQNANKVAQRAENALPPEAHPCHVEYMVSHFVTCPKASQFSGSTRRTQPSKAPGIEPPLTQSGG